MNPDEPGQALTISELVRHSGVGASELSRRSGGVVARQRFNDIKQGEVGGWPTDPKTFSAMARALAVDERQIVLSFARQLGVDVRESRTLLAAMLPAEASRLSVEQASAVAHLIRVFAAGGVGQGLNLRGLDSADKRRVSDLYTELQTRVASATPGMAMVLDHLAAIIDAAIIDAAEED